jgi:hypothetical protein
MKYEVREIFMTQKTKNAKEIIGNSNLRNMEV